MNTITAILTVWKRNHLEEQICALLNQTLPPDFIWVQQTQHHVDVTDTINKYRSNVKYTYWENNPGVFGRFESVKDVHTSHVYIIDDDIIPGKGFIEKALNTCIHRNAIISPHGRLLNTETNQTEVFVGDGDKFQHSFCTSDTEVDFGNNSWFFRVEWIHHFLAYSPLYRKNGEDIHLSASCRLLGDIPTYVPKQIIPYESGNTKRIYSADEFALHIKSNFSLERVNTVNRFREQGWSLRLEHNRKFNVQKRRQIAVSVVMPVLNDNENTEKAINSILNQDFDKFEFIIVHSGKLLEQKYADKRITFIDTISKESYLKMLNIALGLSKGKYVCVMDENVISHPLRIRTQYDIMKNRKKAVAVSYGDYNETHFWTSLFINNKCLKQISYFREIDLTLSRKYMLHSLLSAGDILLYDENLIEFLQ